MANLSFSFDGQSYVSDVFAGGKVVQVMFPKERTQVLFIESRVGSTLPWECVDSRIIERSMIVNIPASGEGQEFRLSCIAEPSSAEFITASSGSGPGHGSVGTDEIDDGGVHREDIDPELLDQLLEDDEVGFIGTDAARSIVSNAIGED